MFAVPNYTFLMYPVYVKPSKKFRCSTFLMDRRHYESSMCNGQQLLDPGVYIRIFNCDANFRKVEVPVDVQGRGFL